MATKPPKSLYHQTANEIADLVQEKNQSYGSAFAKSGSILKILYPNGISTDNYDDMLAIIRILDKLFRIATRKTAFGESPWNDVLGYAILSATRDKALKFSLHESFKSPYTACRMALVARSAKTWRNVPTKKKEALK